MAKNNQKKDQGFEGQLFNLIPPKDFIYNLHENKTSGLFIHSLGYYPNAKYHYYRRTRGSDIYILIYCVSGKGWYSINNEKFDLEPGEVLIIPKKTAHTYGSFQENPWSIFWFHFDGISANHLLTDFFKENVNFKSKIGYSNKCIQLFHEIYNLLSLGFAKENLQHANICFSYFLSSVLYEKIFLNKNLDTHDNINNVLDWMKNNITEKISLNELASKSVYSASHFSMLFKKKTGYAPLDYFNLLKMQESCRQLQNSHLSIKEIAYKLGFNDQYYFSRLFKSIINVSPKKYRQNYFLEKS
ncbi:MAG: AraC family transcriptional regulator [Leadbetterella sp.]